MDQNLEWLQEFIIELSKNSRNIPDYIDDELIQNNPFHIKTNLENMFHLFLVKNPGWRIDIRFANSKYNFGAAKITIEEDNFTNPDGSKDYKHTLTRIIRTNEDGITWLMHFATIPYLCLALELLRKSVIGESYEIRSLREARNKIKHENELLCWLEDFYQDACTFYDYTYDGVVYKDFDCYNGTHINLLYTKQGWVMTVYFEDHSLFEDSEFKAVELEDGMGKIKAYKIDKILIIRMHPRGLIKGLEIFKDWVEDTKTKYGHLYE